MKRKLSRFLSLLLALCLLPLAALAEDTPADMPDPFAVVPKLEGGSPNTLAVLNGELFALTWQNLYRKVEGGWQPALESLSFMSEDEAVHYEPVCLTAVDSTVYLVSQGYTDDAPVFLLERATLENGRLINREGLFNLDLGQPDYYSFYGMAADAENVYLLGFCQSESTWGCNTLYRVSLANGETTAVTKDYLTHLQPYKDGRLLSYYWDQEKAYQQGGEELRPTIVALDGKTGAMTTLCTLPERNMCGLTYDSANDFVYISDDSSLYRYDAAFGEPVRCAYLIPGSRSPESAGAVSDGLYYVTDWSSDEGLTVVSTDPAKIPTQILRLCGYAGNNDDIIRAFAAEHPEVAVTRVDENIYDMEAITQNMLTGDSSADIYVLYFSGSGVYPALRNKGYCLDLSGSTVLTESVKAMYPQLTAQLWKGDKLCALPCEISANSIGYFADGLTEVGMTEDDLPRTIGELIDFCVTWANDYADEYPDFTLFQYAYDLKDQIFSMILQGQIALCAAQGVPLTFDTPIMQKLMAKLDQAAPVLKALSAEPDANGGFYYFDPDTPHAIFTSYCDLVPSRYGNNQRWNGRPLILAMDESVDPAYTVNMSGYLINPNTKNADLAIAYLEFYTEHRNPASRITLDPSVNEPIESEYYAAQLENHQEYMAELEKRLAEAEDPEEITNLKDSLEMMTTSLAYIEEDHWTVSEADIAAYRELAPYLFVSEDDLFSTGATEVSTLMQRYLDGQLGSEKLLKELSRILRMIQLEAQ